MSALLHTTAIRHQFRNTRSRRDNLIRELTREIDRLRMKDAKWKLMLESLCIKNISEDKYRE